MLKSWKENKYEYLEFKDFCYKTNQLSEYYTNYTYKPHAKYILSKSYKVDQSELRIYIIFQAISIILWNMMMLHMF